MPQKGSDKQVPEDQRSRGMNKEHPEGEANQQNQKRQATEGAGGAGRPRRTAGG